MYIGKIVLMGGKIVSVSPSKTYSELIVMHMPLDLEDIPYDKSFSAGPYILSTNRYLDPQYFETEILLTVVAEITGAEQRQYKGESIPMPSMRILEIVLWEPEDKSKPQFEIILGGAMR